MIKDLASAGKTINELIKEKGIKEISKDKILLAAKGIISKNEKAVNDYKAGNNSSMNFLIGQVLRLTEFQAKVEDIREIIEELIK